MQALIFDGKVVQIEAQAFPVASKLAWVDITGVSPAPTVGWLYDGAVFTPPPTPPPEPVLSEAERAESELKKNRAFRALIRRELAQRRAAGETTLTVQDIIDEFKAALP